MPIAQVWPYAALIVSNVTRIVNVALVASRIVGAVAANL
jgi:hypothetical protein